MANFASSSVKPLTVLTEDDGVPGSKIEQDPENYTVEQLKRWLKCRGLKQSGKRGEIVQRVSDCLKGPNHRILDVSIDGGKWFAIKVLKENEELSKKENVKEECVVPAVPASGWRSFPSYDIPVLFNYGHIYYYALESIRTVQLDPSLDVRDEDINKENEMECGLGHMTDKPLKNGRKYVDSKFVHDLMDNKTEQHYFLKGHVWPSMRAELPHNVLIILSATSGAIIHASVAVSVWPGFAQVFPCISTRTHGPSASASWPSALLRESQSISSVSSKSFRFLCGSKPTVSAVLHLGFGRFADMAFSISRFEKFAFSGSGNSCVGPFPPGQWSAHI